MVDGQPLSLFGSALTTGSTHVIIKTAALPDDDSFRSISATIEHAPSFPERTSVIWVKVDQPGFLSVRIWERGAGETMGCGTGSAAAAADYMRRSGRAGKVIVKNPGGILTVSAERWDSALTIEGTASQVFEGFYLTEDLL
jgi:diaminopimelate epimerase